MLKLDLQMFAEGDGGVETPVEMPSFADMYNNGPQVEEPDNDTVPGTDDDIVNNDSGEVAGGDTDPADDDNQQSQIQQQPWKNEQNAQFAAQRRRLEEQQRTAQAVQAARDAVYAEQYKGQVNPYTGQPIRSEADYKAYQQAYNAEVLKNSGITQAQFDQMVNADPRIQQAATIAQQQQEMMRQMQQQKQAQELNEAVDKIRKIDKSVKTEQDIINNPHFQQIAQYYSKGLTLDEAYYLANRAELEQQKQAATRQQVINQATSKQHMKATGQQGVGDDIVIPPDQMAMYRRFFPNMPEADLKKHYARMTKQKG